MLTKKHMRPQVSSKLPLTMGEKKKAIGRASSREVGASPSTAVPPHRGDMSQTAAPRGAVLAPPAQPLPVGLGGFSGRSSARKWAALTQGSGAIDT